MRTNAMMRKPVKGWQAESYDGWRHPDGMPCTVHRINGKAREPLHWRLDLENHSPDGLEWGYHGSGPAQLALALLADALDDDALAVRLHQDFKAAVVATLPRQGWTMPRAAIVEWVKTYEAKEEGKAAAPDDDGDDDDEDDDEDEDDDDDEPEAEDLVNVVDRKGKVKAADLPRAEAAELVSEHRGWQIKERD